MRKDIYFTTVVLILAAIVLSWRGAVSAEHRHKRLFSGKFLHPPVKTGKCSACHDLHFSRIDSQLREDPPDLCFRCHAKFKGKGLHPPVRKGQCLRCHAPHSSSDHRLLNGTIPGVCLSCHPEQKGGKHGRATMPQDCTGCHDPHGSQSAKLLKAASFKNCLSCHSEVTAGKVKHSALDEYECDECHNPHADPPVMPPLSCEECHDDMHEGDSFHASVKWGNCTRCHDPHTSANPNHLKSFGPPSDIDCLGCHYPIDRKLRRGKSVHQPVSGKTCSNCHTLHTGPKPFLRKRYATTIHAPYSRETYELCFECHSSDMLETPFTISKTAFRRGARNLHYRHVVRNGETGISCGSCHDVHGSMQPHLIMEETSIYARYQLHIRYKAFDKGGSCSSNCHTVKEYSR